MFTVGEKTISKQTLFFIANPLVTKIYALQIHIKVLILGEHGEY